MEADTGFLPPYNVPWATFYNTIEKVAADLPNKVDRSYLGSASGGLKSYLISAFKNFGLIDDDHTVREELKTMATNPEQRPQLIADLLRLHYPKAVELGTTNATPGELDGAFAEMFPSLTGESRTKAMRWYLSAADYAGLPRSALWKTPKAGASGPRKKTQRRAATNNGQESAGEQEQVSTDRSLRRFKLPSGRTLTISIDGDVLMLPRDERKFVMATIDSLEETFEDAAASAADDAAMKAREGE